MKKIISLLLVALVLASVVSCSEAEMSESENSSGISSEAQSESTIKPVESSEAANNSETSEEENLYPETDGCKWDTKEVMEPIFEECTVKEAVVATDKSGKEITTELLVTPFQVKDFDLNKTKDELKKTTLLKDWFLGIEEHESGKVTLYSEIGQKTSYGWYKAIVGDTSETGGLADLSISYEGNTETSVGYTKINFEIDVPKDKVHNEIQGEVFEALKKVYGDKTAEYLCYAPLKEKNLLCEIKQKNATIFLRREVYETGTKYNRCYRFFFAIIVTPNDTDSFEGFEGEGEYVPLVGTPEYFFDIFSTDIGKFNMNDFENAASDLLTKHYDGYTSTFPHYGYSYSVENGDNGYKYVDMSFDSYIGAEGIAKLYVQDFTVDYSIYMKDGVATNVCGDFRCGVGACLSDDSKKEQYRKELLEKGIEMMEMITKEKFSPEEFVYDEKNKTYNPVVRKMEIMGIEKDVSFIFEFGSNMGGYYGYIHISFLLGFN